MKEPMINKLKNIVLMAIDNEKSLVEVTKRIAEKMRQEFSGYWQCFAFSHFGSCYTGYADNKYIRFRIGDLDIILFQ